MVKKWDKIWQEQNLPIAGMLFIVAWSAVMQISCNKSLFYDLKTDLNPHRCHSSFCCKWCHDDDDDDITADNFFINVSANFNFYFLNLFTEMNGKASVQSKNSTRWCCKEVKLPPRVKHIIRRLFQNNDDYLILCKFGSHASAVRF